MSRIRNTLNYLKKLFTNEEEKMTPNIVEFEKLYELSEVNMKLTNKYKNCNIVT